MNSFSFRLLRTGNRILSVSPYLGSRVLDYFFTRPRGLSVAPRDEEVMAQARRWRLPFSERSLQVYEWGSGPIVVLVHGWSGRASQLAGYVGPLVERGYRVVAFDGPSHGASEGRRSALPEFAFALEALAAHLGPLHGIAAHSLGTAASTLALSRGVIAKRLAYIAPPEDLRGYLARLAGLLGFSSETVDRARARLEAQYGVAFEAARGRNLGPHRAEPLWVAHDSQDREVPFKEGQRLVEVWEGDKALFTTSGWGHSRILRHPEVVRRAVEHLHGRPVEAVA